MKVGKNRTGEAQRRGILSTMVDFREGVPEEVTHKLRALKGMDIIQMEMGRGVVGLDCSREREKRACREAQ